MPRKGNGKATGNRAETEALLRAAFEQHKAAGTAIGITQLADDLDINRSTIYQYPILAAEISEYAKQTQPKLSRRGAGVPLLEAHKREINGNIRRDYTRVIEENGKLRRKLLETEQKSAALKEENQKLKLRLQRLAGAYTHILTKAINLGMDAKTLDEQQILFSLD